MTTQELEVVIRESLKDIYKADYIGKLEITKDSYGYLIKLGVQTPEAPISLYIETNDDKKLISFIKKDLRDRNLNPRFFGNISLVYPDINPKCINKKCCDTPGINR